mmetsp:Transcript_22955/g.71355  ORF Transcript_22955/g.71355 Transcript_22955/m.71355 type:complete len:662 (-) Transcript_22955:82-2067(-)
MPPKAAPKRARRWRRAEHAWTGDEKRRETKAAAEEGGPAPRFQKALPEELPEPQHRVGPPGVSSGLSLRRFPTSTIDELRRVCTHYEDKCGGKYAATSPAARYLFQMSREIMIQLSALEAWLQEKTKMAASVNEERRQWDEHFSPSAKQRLLVGLPNAAFATPAEIAQYVRDMQELLQQRQDQAVAAERQSRTEVDNLQNILQSHRAVARVQADEDRRRHEEDLAAARAQLEDVVRDLSAKYNEVLLDLEQRAEAAVEGLRAEMAARDEAFEAERQEAEAAAEANLAEAIAQARRVHANELARAHGEAEEREGQLARKIDMLHAALKEARTRATKQQAKGHPSIEASRNDAARDQGGGNDDALVPAGVRARHAKEVGELQSELLEARRRSEALERRVVELEDMNAFLREGSAAVAEAQAEIRELVQPSATPQTRDVFAQDQVQARLGPTYWNAINVAEDAGESPAFPSAAARAALKPRHPSNSLAWASEPWSRGKPIPRDTQAALRYRPRTATAWRESEARVHEYCESFRKPRSTPAEVAEEEAPETEKENVAVTPVEAAEAPPAEAAAPAAEATPPQEETLTPTPAEVAAIQPKPKDPLAEVQKLELPLSLNYGYEHGKEKPRPTAEPIFERITRVPIAGDRGIWGRVRFAESRNSRILS